MFDHLFICFSYLAFFVCIGYGQECGKKQATFPHLEIVGGHDAQLGEYPWQVSLQVDSGNGYSHFCGGSIIDTDLVLTAAHCFVTSCSHAHCRTAVRNGGLQVVAGIIDLTKSEESQQTITASDYIVHEDFNESTGQNDVALVKLESSFTFGQYVASICLPKSLQETTGTATITGWGAIQQDGPFSNVLQEIELPVITNDECSESYPDKIVDSMICVADTSATDYTGPCQGDSGGPMVSNDADGDGYYISGIISWGNGCSDAHPSVLTQVSYFIDWINEHKQ